MTRLGSTSLLCLMVFANTFGVGAFNPLLPEIARAQSLADWQIGVLAGAFGFARMLADVPTGMLAGRRLGLTLASAPAVLAAGLVLLGTGGPLAVLVLGRVLTGLGHTLAMVGGLTAILLDHRHAGGSLRLNLFEFSGMLGVLGGLTAVGVLPTRWGWPSSLLLASSPFLLTFLLVPDLRRHFPDQRHPRGAPAALPAGVPREPRSMPPIVWLMFGVGIIMGLSWSSVSQFMIPLRGTREFGLERGGISRLLALAQLADLVALLPVAWLADGIGRVLVLAMVAAAVGFGTWAVGLGSFPLFVAGCALFGVGMAGWMFPLAVIRDHTDTGAFAWRTGLYRVGVDGAVFLGPFVCGLLGERHTGPFMAVVGLAALAAAAQLGWRAVR